MVWGGSMEQELGDRGKRLGALEATSASSSQPEPASACRLLAVLHQTHLCVSFSGHTAAIRSKTRDPNSRVRPIPAAVRSRDPHRLTPSVSYPRDWGAGTSSVSREEAAEQKAFIEARSLPTPVGPPPLTVRYPLGAEG